MISHPDSVLYVSPCGVSKQMRDAAKLRDGDWEVVTYDWDWEHPDFGCVGRTFGLGMAKLCGYDERGKVLQKTVVRFKESEVSRFLHIYTHGIRNHTKPEQIHGNLEQTAETYWPTGSLEHVAMRQLGVAVLVRAFSGHRLTCSPRHQAALGCFLPTYNKYLKTELRRLTGPSRGASNHSDGNNANSNDANGKNSSDPKDKGVPAKGQDTKDDKPGDPPPPGAGSATDMPPAVPFMHGGNTPADAEIIANEQNRVYIKDGICMIVGQDFDGKDPDNKQIVGVLTAPTPKKPNVYNNSSLNAKAAKRKRLDEKANPYTGTTADEIKIALMVNEACGSKMNRGVFSEKRIRRWAEEKLHLLLIKSGKWSDKRLTDSLMNLLKQAYPEIKLKCSVKAEPMAEGKAPRLLIADGDDGQLMALLVVKCFEDLLFEWFESKSIKHAAKRPAVKRVLSFLEKKGAKLIEGDGSAWDTTCNAMIRGLVENPCLRHILRVLVPYGVVPEQWHEEHMKCSSKKQLKLFFSKKMDKMKMTIVAIRRSGGRGTSCLNWWENFVNWTCSIFKEPERFLDPNVRNGEDVTGNSRWWNGAFEGDDSLCALFPAMEKGDDLDKMFLGWWARMGFNMEIIYADRRATFCGTHIACVNGEATGLICPELPRALVGAGVSVSSTIIEAAKAGNIDVVKDIAAAGAIARAADFAGILPTVSRKFHRYAMELKRSRDVVDREMSMRVMGEEGHSFTAIEGVIETQNLAVTPTEEAANLKALGYDATFEELDTFTVQSWTFEGIGDYEGHRASLPVSWRPAKE